MKNRLTPIVKLGGILCGSQFLHGSAMQETFISWMKRFGNKDILFVSPASQS
jgi:hypothetical protein